jgi:hypothetical protein
MANFALLGRLEEPPMRRADGAVNGRTGAAVPDGGLHQRQGIGVAVLRFVETSKIIQ